MTATTYEFTVFAADTAEQAHVAARAECDEYFGDIPYSYEIDVTAHHFMSGDVAYRKTRVMAYSK